LHLIWILVFISDHFITVQFFFQEFFDNMMKDLTLKLHFLYA